MMEGKLRLIHLVNLVQISCKRSFLDFGIVDAITDKHRNYPASFVIPVRAK